MPKSTSTGMALSGSGRSRVDWLRSSAVIRFFRVRRISRAACYILNQSYNSSGAASSYARGVFFMQIKASSHHIFGCELVIVD
jgi:hypothetical protein